MEWKQKFQGGVLGFVGFMLSPLSWWNDALVNLPLALAFGWLVALAYRPAFVPAVVLGYWLTNVLGFFLMHQAARKLLNARDKPYSRRDLIRDLGISLLYTLLILLLIQLGVLRPVANYFPEM